MNFKEVIMTTQRKILHDYQAAAKDLDEFEGEMHLIPTWLFLLMILGFTLFLLISFSLL
jgi:hypothetical protein